MVVGFAQGDLKKRPAGPVRERPVRGKQSNAGADLPGPFERKWRKKKEYDIAIVGGGGAGRRRSTSARARRTVVFEGKVTGG
jgi:hypothetical protein